MSESPEKPLGEQSIPEYLTTLQDLGAREWDRFWFTPQDPYVLGLLRVVTGLIVLYAHVIYSLDLPLYLGEQSLLDAELTRFEQPTAQLSYWWDLPTGWVWPVHLASLSVLLLFACGLFTRVTSILAWLVVLSYANRLHFVTYGFDQTTAMLMFYLAIGPSGDAWSVDRWLRSRKGSGGAGSRISGPASIGARVATRLIQVHMCVIYLYAGLAKLTGEAWWHGEAMWMAFANREFQTLDMTWIAWRPYLYSFLTHMTVVFELTFCVLVWKPIVRPLVLAAAVLLHTGIGVCLGMWPFGLIMLAGCGAFVSPAWLRRVLRVT